MKISQALAVPALFFAVLVKKVGTRLDEILITATIPQ
jgi:hypothetical protein